MGVEKWSRDLDTEVFADLMRLKIIYFRAEIGLCHPLCLVHHVITYVKPIQSATPSLLFHRLEPYVHVHVQVQAQVCTSTEYIHMNTISVRALCFRSITFQLHTFLPHIRVEHKWQRRSMRGC